MAQTLYFPDGTHEVIFGDPEETLRRVIDERLGRDCEQLYTGLLEEARHPFGDCPGEDFEHIADGYLTLLTDTMKELESILDMFNASRLDRQKVRRHLKAAYDNIYKNI